MLREGSTLIAGCDEVGRGALAGPVTVGIVVVDGTIGRVPQGLADSKLLSPQRREALVPAIHRWGRAHAVGHASPGEIDRWGLTIALRLAGQRALSVIGVQPDLVLLDGSYDWLSPRDEQAAMWEIDLTEPAASGGPKWPECQVPRVVTQIKADMVCASVAAASVLAKVTRDAIMTDLSSEHPHFAWHENKGYASDWHREQLRERGPCDHHRRSWRLGLDNTAADDVDNADNADDFAGEFAGRVSEDISGRERRPMSTVEVDTGVLPSR
jgi:ribonuclease HII